MISIQENINLKQYNTFGISVIAKRFVCVKTIDDLIEIISTEKDIFLLGGGSNMLLTKDLNSLVVKVDLKGISFTNFNDNYVLVTAQAGENWHNFVLWCIDKNFGGLENLSLIPGNVGSAPIQNIGAYGVEVKDYFYQLTALEVSTQKVKTFTLEQCHFGYRNSIFKNTAKGQYVITSVTFKLTKQNHTLHTNYGAIKESLKEHKTFSIKEISEAVIKIRQSKLPNPKEIGNSGSFFKNPEVNLSAFKKLQQLYPKIPNYKITENSFKIPAGWLIEQCGFKGKRFGECGVHKNQALVLVNYGNATGIEIFNLAQKIKEAVYNKFKINLEIEVNVI